MGLYVGEILHLGLGISSGSSTGKKSKADAVTDTLSGERSANLLP